MKRHTKLTIFTAVIAVILTATITNATANRLSIDERFVDIIWRTLRFSGAGGLVNIRCPVTLLASFHERTTDKVFLRLIAVVRHAQVGRPTQCTGGEATIASETLPWHVRYDSFRGLLPRIDSVRLLLVSASFRINAGGINCNARATLERPAKGDVALSPITGQATGIVPDPAVGIPIEGGGFCPTSGNFENTGTVTKLNGGLLFVRLI